MLNVAHDETGGGPAGASFLDEIVGNDTRRMLAAALQAEVAAYIGARQRGRRGGQAAGSS